RRMTPFGARSLDSPGSRASFAGVLGLLIQVVPLLVFLLLDGPTLVALMRDGGGSAILAPVAFGLAGVMLGHALYLVLRRWLAIRAWRVLHPSRVSRTRSEAGVGRRERVMALLWLGMTLVAAVTWPDATSPWDAPLASLAFYVTAAVFPSALAESARRFASLA